MKFKSRDAILVCGMKPKYIISRIVMYKKLKKPTVVSYAVRSDPEVLAAKPPITTMLAFGYSRDIYMI